MEEGSKKRDPPPTEERHPSIDTRPIHPQLHPLSPLSRSRTWNGRSLLYDSYELDTITQEHNQALNYPQPSINSKEKHPYTAHLQLQTPIPIWRTGCWKGGSTLYDSHELKSIIQDLDRAFNHPPLQEIPDHKCPLKAPINANLQLRAQTPATAIHVQVQDPNLLRQSSRWLESSMLYGSCDCKSVAEETDPVQHHPPSQERSREQHLCATPTTMHLHVQARTPIWRLIPWNKGSTLYDSHELKAFTQQLNHALSMTHARSKPRTSAFHPSSQRLDRLYKGNANAPKRVTCASIFERASDAKANNKKNHGVMPKLWKKLKQAILRSKQARSKTSGA